MRPAPLALVLALAPVVAAAVLAGCEPSGPRACESDSDCGADACLDGICGVALEDPGGPAVSPGGRVRVHAVGLHPTLADVETQTTWRTFVRARVERDVVAALATDRPNLVVLPENTTLTTAFIGSRGAMGRMGSSSTGALTDVLSGYLSALDYYNPRIDPETPIGRMLGLVTTDTVYRAIEPFRELAREHELWIALTGDFADAERTTDPAAITAVVDEAEADRSFAWIATSDDVFNQTIVIDPSGEIVHRWRKVYLVPIEEDGLDLSYGPPHELTSFDLPFARAASVISKDAWMPDVLDRLALDGTSLLLQPEAFSGWGIPEGEDGAWPPDVVRESGWASIQRFPEFQASVLPCWNGNLFELVFDCQSSILTQSRHDATAGAWIGQDDEPGYAAIASWAVEDDRVGTIEERRARLQAVGERLAPGSGDPIENQYADGGVFVDLDLAGGWPARAADAEEIAIAPIDAGEQRRPALASTGDGSFVALWEDTRNGQTRIYGARGRLEEDGSLALGEARVRVATEGEPRRPRVVARGDEVHLVWQERRGEDDDALHARSIDGGRSFSAPDALAIARDRAQWTPDVAMGARATFATWIEHLDEGARVIAAPIGGAPEMVVPAELPYSTRGNQHLPAIAMVDDDPVIAWTDFAAYRWEIHVATRTAPGTYESERLDDAEVPFETLHTDPRVVVGDGPPIVAWTDLRVRRADHDVRARRFRGGGSIALASTDGSGRPQWRPAIAVRGDRLIVVWQDMRAGGQSLRYAVSDDGGGTFAPDAPLFGTEDQVDRFGPEVVFLDDGHALVAYETTASGSRRVALRLLSL